MESEDILIESEDVSMESEDVLMESEREESGDGRKEESSEVVIITIRIGAVI